MKSRFSLLLLLSGFLIKECSANSLENNPGTLGQDSTDEMAISSESTFASVPLSTDPDPTFSQDQPDPIVHSEPMNDPPIENPTSKPVIVSTPFHYSVNAALNYWYAKEDGMNLAENAILLSSGITVNSPNGHILEQSFSYKPGFQVGFGIEYLDLWNLNAKYTYFRGSTTTSKSAPNNTTNLEGTGVWNLDSWYLQVSPISYQSLTGTYLSSKWKLSMDLGDLTVSPSFKKKGMFEFAPLGGLRVLWLRQHLNLALVQALDSIGASDLLPPQPLKSFNSSNGWGIGPRFGCQGICTLPLGLYLAGLFGTSLLYMQYTSVKHFEQKADLSYDFPLKTSRSNYNCVRAIVDLNLCIGWSRKIYEKYNLDLSANYDFSYFWNQNIMRSMLDSFAEGSSSNGLDLYFQGPTFSASFKF